MHHFNYRNNELYCEGVRVAEIARACATPVYIYSHRTLIDHYRKIREAFSQLNPLICFSMKSNSNLAVCKALINEGAGLDIVSGGELFKALKIGANPKRIVYASVGKTETEIETALNAGILFFNVESLPELTMINRVCRRIGKRANVALRINPGVAAQTHHYITTGIQQNKFGVDPDTAVKIFKDSDNFGNVDIRGLHIHIGSQITEAGPFVKAIKKVSLLITLLRKKGYRIEYLNIGGGLGIIYHKERPQTAESFAKAVILLLKKLKVKVILEPGRFISGPSGILVARVIYVKRALRKNFIIIDAGMNDLLRPSLYEAYHEVLPVIKMQARQNLHFDVVGPICESGDFIAKDRQLPLMREGDLMAVMGAGAYGFSMSSNYNARPRAAEVMVIGKRHFVVRKREVYSDLIRGEVIPSSLRGTK